MQTQTPRPTRRPQPQDQIGHSNPLFPSIPDPHTLTQSRSSGGCPNPTWHPDTKNGDVSKSSAAALGFSMVLFQSPPGPRGPSNPSRPSSANSPNLPRLSSKRLRTRHLLPRLRPPRTPGILRDMPPRIPRVVQAAGLDPRQLAPLVLPLLRAE
jgi:hypothetical protein